MHREVVTERGESGMILSIWEDGGTIPEMGKTGEEGEEVRRGGTGGSQDFWSGCVEGLR